jgi:hypothetical protein
MRAIQDIRKEVEERNKWRSDVGLPLLDVENEVKKMVKYEQSQDYYTWVADHPELHERVRAEILAKERESRNDPEWLPRGLLNGGMAYGRQVDDRMRELYHLTTGQ